MSWENFFLICFIVGFASSLLSFVLGIHDVDLSHHGHFFSPHGPDGAHGGGGLHGIDSHAGPMHVSPFNLATVMAFLAWFGGAGYLATHYWSMWLLAAFAIAIVAGLVGGSVVFWFLAKVLVAHDHSMKPADYDMSGVLARVSSSIREGGTGEIVYSQGGTRRCAAARSEDGTAVGKGEEVVVIRYVKGIAYVRRWDDVVGQG